MSALAAAVFPPGLFTASFMIHAWIAGTAVAVMSGLVGVFVNLRGGTFAAHAIPRAAFTGAAAAFLVGVSSVLGMAACALGMALSLGALERRDRGGSPGVLTALLLIAILSLGDLLLTVGNAYAPEVYALLFGQVVGISAAQTIQIAILAALLALLVGVLFRPLLYYTVSPETALARGVPEGAMRLGFMAMVAGAAALTVPVVGALLSFALLVGPAAAARRIARRPGRMVAWSMGLGTLTVWLSILIAYDTVLPSGFVVTAIAAILYVLAVLYDRLGRKDPRAAAEARKPAALAQ